MSIQNNKLNGLLVELAPQILLYFAQQDSVTFYGLGGK